MTNVIDAKNSAVFPQKEDGIFELLTLIEVFFSSKVPSVFCSPFSNHLNKKNPLTKCRN